MSRCEQVHRRRFLQSALEAGAVLAAPWLIPGGVLGKGGGVPLFHDVVLSTFVQSGLLGPRVVGSVVEASVL